MEAGTSTTGHGRREGVDTGGGTADGGRRGDRGVPGRTRRAHDATVPARRAGHRRAAAGPPGQRVGRRRAARRVEEPEPDASRRAARRPGGPPAGAGRAGPGRRRRPACPSPARPRVHAQGCRPSPSRRGRRAAGSRTAGRPAAAGPIPPLPGLAPPPPGGHRPPRKQRPARPERPPASPGRRRLGRALLALGVVVGVVVLYHLGLYFYVDQKIDRVEALATDGPEVLAPALQAGAENYLVVGSGVPGQDGGSSVATLLASVSADGDRAVLVSFPPTALVDTPECRTRTGSLRTRRRRRSHVLCWRAGPRAWCGRSSSCPACASTTTSASTWPGCRGWSTRSAASRSASPRRRRPSAAAMPLRPAWHELSGDDGRRVPGAGRHRGRRHGRRRRRARPAPADVDPPGRDVDGHPGRPGDPDHASSTGPPTP